MGRAKALNRSSTGVLGDLEAALFPKSEINLSDRMLSHCHQFLSQIIAAIETELCLRTASQLPVEHDILNAISESDQSPACQSLKKTNMLNNRELLAHVLMVAQRAELQARLLQKISQEDLENTFTQYLDHPDAAIGEAAMALLIAQNRSAADHDARITELPAEILYQLVWPIVAALEKVASFEGPELVTAGKSLLAAHDESQSVQSRALRLASLLEQEGQAGAQFPHPFRDGLDLSIARLACHSGLTMDQIMLFTAEPQMARLVILLRGLNIPVDEALSIFVALDRSGSLLIAASYKEIQIEDAQSLIGAWSMPAVYQNTEQSLSNSQWDVG